MEKYINLEVKFGLPRSCVKWIKRFFNFDGTESDRFEIWK